MSKEKQIEEMAKVIHKADENCGEYFPISMSECLHKHGRFRTNAATELYNAGYRKQSELTPCDVCKFNPPSSGDGKPCLFCPAQAKMKGAES